MHGHIAVHVMKSFEKPQLLMAVGLIIGVIKINLDFFPRNVFKKKQLYGKLRYGCFFSFLL